MKRFFLILAIVAANIVLAIIAVAAIRVAFFYPIENLRAPITAPASNLPPPQAQQ